MKKPWDLQLQVLSDDFYMYVFLEEKRMILLSIQTISVTISVWCTSSKLQNQFFTAYEYPSLTVCPFYLFTCDVIILLPILYAISRFNMHCEKQKTWEELVAITRVKVGVVYGRNCT